MAHPYGLDRLKRLSQIKTKKDIKQLSYAQFPGTHCPLFGVALTASLIKNMIVLVVGTDECTYYTKTFIIGREFAGQGDDNFLSFSIAQEDVVFGAMDKVRDTLLFIDKTYNPEAIMVVTTCIPEITGEDYRSLIISLSGTVKASLLIVRTEHFSCNNHLPGIERTLEALGDVMEKREVIPGTVNILGHRHSGIEKTELFSILAAEGIRINLSIPSKCSVKQLKEASSAQLNIVTDETALMLAEKMRCLFGTDYVFFGKYGSIKRIAKAYGELSIKLNLRIERKIETLMKRAEVMLRRIGGRLNGKTFIYGNSPMQSFEACALFCSLGMKPLLVQARDIYETDASSVKEILNSGNDPLIAAIANITPLRPIYELFAPDMYIGHEFPQVLASYGISHIVLDRFAEKLGFELPEAIAAVLAETCDRAKDGGRKENHHVAL